MRPGRTVITLAACQALGMSAASGIVLVGGLAGSDLAPQPSFATFPIAAYVVGAALSSVPAALIMRRIGRKAGFLIGAIVGAGAASLAAAGIVTHSFALLCAATLFVGSNSAFTQQYRFAAAESARPEQAGRAVSFVMLGGVVAGFLGPELANRTRMLLSSEYAGSFLALAGLQLLLLPLLLSLEDVRTTTRDTPVAGAKRPLSVVLRQPTFILAACAGVTAFGVMSFLMTATPISMRVIDHHPVEQATRVIQAHIIAMFTPAVFSGYLVDRLGPIRMVVTGAISLLVAVLIAPANHEVDTYTFSLTLIGIGWNFLFVGATVLLTRTWRPAERFAVQATNDAMVLGAQATGSLCAGIALDRLGWDMMNRIALVPVLLTLALVLLTRSASSLRTAGAPAAD